MLRKYTCNICDLKGYINNFGVNYLCECFFKYCLTCSGHGWCPNCQGSGRRQAFYHSKSCGCNRFCYVCNGTGESAVEKNMGRETLYYTKDNKLFFSYEILHLPTDYTKKKHCRYSITGIEIPKEIIEKGIDEIKSTSKKIIFDYLTEQQKRDSIWVKINKELNYPIKFIYNSIPMEGVLISINNDGYAKIKLVIPFVEESMFCVFSLSEYDIFTSMGEISSVLREVIKEKLIKIFEVKKEKDNQLFELVEKLNSSNGRICI